MYRLLVGKNMRQRILEFALWARGMVRELINREFRSKVSKTSIGLFRQLLGSGTHRPVCKDAQDDEILVVEWGLRKIVKLKKTDKGIKCRDIFADERSLLTDKHSGTSGSPNGKIQI